MARGGTTQQTFGIQILRGVRKKEREREIKSGLLVLLILLLLILQSIPIYPLCFYFRLFTAHTSPTFVCVFPTITGLSFIFIYLKFQTLTGPLMPASPTAPISRLQTVKRLNRRATEAFCGRKTLYSRPALLLLLLLLHLPPVGVRVAMQAVSLTTLPMTMPALTTRTVCLCCAQLWRARLVWLVG